MQNQTVTVTFILKEPRTPDTESNNKQAVLEWCRSKGAVILEDKVIIGV